MAGREIGRRVGKGGATGADVRMQCTVVAEAAHVPAKKKRVSIATQSKEAPGAEWEKPEDEEEEGEEEEAIVGMRQQNPTMACSRKFTGSL